MSGLRHAQTFPPIAWETYEVPWLCVPISLGQILSKYQARTSRYTASIRSISMHSLNVIFSESLDVHVYLVTPILVSSYSAKARVANVNAAAGCKQAKVIVELLGSEPLSQRTRKSRQNTKEPTMLAVREFVKNVQQKLHMMLRQERRAQNKKMSPWSLLKSVAPTHIRSRLRGT